MCIIMNERRSDLGLRYDFERRKNAALHQCTMLIKTFGSLGHTRVSAGLQFFGCCNVDPAGCVCK